MFGLGELGKLFIAVIYIILSLPILLLLFILIHRIISKRKTAKLLIWTVLSSIPLIVFSYAQYEKHRKEDLSQVGTYFLNEYPNCSDCKLILSEDNTYVVTGTNSQIESGEWRYDEGNDYFIVTLSNGRQLGSGQYQYYKYELKYKKQ
jgi:hypothetical protein